MAGRIEVITGPMYSGKTTELLRRLERYYFAKKTYYAVKPEQDTRKQNTSITTIRGTIAMDFEPVAMLAGFPKEADIVVLDEAQFFHQELVSFCQYAKDLGKIVLVSGLDMDFNRKPFGHMGQLMAIADTVTKLTAVCACGNDATYTKKISGDKTRQIEVGDHCYIPSCAECYFNHP
jgi:thymidine kinase